jgi:hypothetical protein
MTRHNHNINSKNFVVFFLLSISVNVFSQKIAFINFATDNLNIKGATIEILNENSISDSIFKNYLNEEIAAATLSLKQIADSVYFINDTVLSNQLRHLPFRLYNCFATANGKMDYIRSTSRTALNS